MMILYLTFLACCVFCLAHEKYFPLLLTEKNPPSKFLFPEKKTFPPIVLADDLTSCRPTASLTADDHRLRHCRLIVQMMPTSIGSKAHFVTTVG
ncbi:hypothetical protein L1987_61925 [Smallanthus sonchifolius]|uniref:Uncharacterized protein n=1 Tax=Smallanthus sonchifolius TaxID=185202 RepID=A0ACB9C927_9ASTR|nr:hypothetical protein L1987_61925 [Smallanthus sonchifolius]